MDELRGASLLGSTPWEVLRVLPIMRSWDQSAEKHSRGHSVVLSREEGRLGPKGGVGMSRTKLWYQGCEADSSTQLRKPWGL